LSEHVLVKCLSYQKNHSLLAEQKQMTEKFRFHLAHLTISNFYSRFNSS